MTDLDRPIIKLDLRACIEHRGPESALAGRLNVGDNACGFDKSYGSEEIFQFRGPAQRP